MRAAIFKGPGEGFAIEERPTPTPGPGEILLRVARCGICKTDLSLTGGHGELLARPGTILGHEFAGDVVAVGEGVDLRTVGDRVAALPVAGCGRCGSCLEGQPFWCTGGLRAASGGFAEYAVVSARETVLLPDNLSDDDGAIVEPLASSLHGVHLAGLAPGMRVAIQGAGPIGLGATFWARRLGAGRVAVVDTSRTRERFADVVGAHAFVVADGGDLPSAVAGALGGPPDVVIEAAGYPGALRQAIELVKPQGTIVVLGYCTVEDAFVPARAVNKQLRVQFSFCYGVPEFQFAVDALAAGAVEPRVMVTDVVPLDRLPAAFEALRRPSDQCKVLVDPQALT